MVATPFFGSDEPILSNICQSLPLQRAEIERDGPLSPSSLSIVTGNENPWHISDLVYPLPNVLGNEKVWPIKHLADWR
jgi:hypothetical protein